MGDYRDKSGSERVDAPEKIDLTNVMLDVYHGVKRLWWLFIGLIIICAVQSYFSVSTSYQSKYVASATVSVTSVGGMDYVNAQSAQQMAEVFPYILTSGVLKDVVAEDMGLDSMPGSIDVKADDGTNLLTISVSGNDPQMAYKTLKSVIKNYPKVAEFVLGETKLTILDETGIPTDTWILQAWCFKRCDHRLCDSSAVCAFQKDCEVKKGSEEEYQSAGSGKYPVCPHEKA